MIMSKCTEGVGSLHARGCIVRPRRRVSRVFAGDVGRVTSAPTIDPKDLLKSRWTASRPVCVARASDLGSKTHTFATTK